MTEEKGEWYLHGVSKEDPSCIHTAGELEERVKEIGFLPLFAGGVAGFSVEEMTDPEGWWSADPERDPWEWREILAGRGEIAYGKFFNGRAGFISRNWLPYFANYRRDGYDFDARWDDELASGRQKKIMDLFSEEHADSELFSYEVKQKAGFGRGGEKNFEGTLTQLQMMLYLVCRDFRQRVSKKGDRYGWAIAVLCTPEHLFGADLVRAAYDEEPKESLGRITGRVKKFFPEASEEDITRLIALPEDRPKKSKNLPYPQNLLKAIDRKKDPWSWSKDQVSGLYVALGQLRDKQQRALREKYQYGMTNEEIGAGMNRAAGTIATYRRKGLARLRVPLVAAWYRDGYRKNLAACAAGEHWKYPASDPGDEISGQDYCLRIGLKVVVFEQLAGAGILTVDDLIRAIRSDDRWYRNIRGVGPARDADIRRKLGDFGFLSE